MKTPKVKAPPPTPTAIPIPQLEDKSLVDVGTRRRAEIGERDGSSASLLAGGARGDTSDSGTRKRRLGPGSMAY